MLLNKKGLNYLSRPFYFRCFNFTSNENVIINNEWRQKRSIQLKLVTNDMPFELVNKLQRNNINVLTQTSKSLIDNLNLRDFNTINM
jgi:hypothetical protein